MVVGKIYRNESVFDMLARAGVTVHTYEENGDWNDELKNIFSEEISERKNEGKVELKEKF